MKVEALH